MAGREIIMKKNTLYVTLLLVAVFVIGAIYWFSKGYVASSALQKSLLTNVKWLGTILTVLLLAVGAFILNKVHKKDK